MTRIRLAERSVLVLTSLAGGDRHGYALIKDIESFSGVALSPGTLYGALAKLEADGFVAESARIASLGLERIALGGS